LVRVGRATEFLYVTEGWNRQAPLPGAEALLIIWRTEREMKMHTCVVRSGKYRKYLEVMGAEWQAEVQAANPMFNPWHTTKDIFDFAGVPEEKRDYEWVEKAYCDLVEYMKQASR
jgi:hypothetical protein